MIHYGKDSPVKALAVMNLTYFSNIILCLELRLQHNYRIVLIQNIQTRLYTRIYMTYIIIVNTYKYICLVVMYRSTKQISNVMSKKTIWKLTVAILIQNLCSQMCGSFPVLFPVNKNCCQAKLLKGCHEWGLHDLVSESPFFFKCLVVD